MQQSLILSLVVAVSLAAFENTHVQNLSTASFQDVLQGNEFWLVLFHNGNLGALEKTYQDTARALGNMVNVASVQDPEYASPQVKVFSTNKEEPVLFEEEFTAQKLVEFAFEHVRNVRFCDSDHASSTPSCEWETRCPRRRPPRWRRSCRRTT